MAEILSTNSPSGQGKEINKEGFFRSIWGSYRSLDRFTQGFILTTLLLIVITPYIVNQYLNTLQEAAGVKSDGESSASNCQGINTKGNVSNGGTIIYTLSCNNPNTNVEVSLTFDAWAQDRDLAIRITDPNGAQQIIDSENSATEVYQSTAPILTGAWKIEVINQESQQINYDIRVNFTK